MHQHIPASLVATESSQVHIILQTAICQICFRMFIFINSGVWSATQNTILVIQISQTKNMKYFLHYF